MKSILFDWGSGVCLNEVGVPINNEVISKRSERTRYLTMDGYVRKGKLGYNERTLLGNLTIAIN